MHIKIYTENFSYLIAMSDRNGTQILKVFHLTMNYFCKRSKVHKKNIYNSPYPTPKALKGCLHLIFVIVDFLVVDFLVWDIQLPNPKNEWVEIVLLSPPMLVVFLNLEI